MKKEEERQLVELLAKLEPGFLPYEIFVQIARLVTLPIIEFVPLRVRGGEVEVLLLERDADDEFWPGEVHVPGTVVRPTDSLGEIYKAFDRIRRDELQNTNISEPYFVGSILHKSKRGMEQAQVFWVEVLEDPRVGKFYPVEQLPDNLIESQRGFINEAIRSYRASKDS